MKREKKKMENTNENVKIYTEAYGVLLALGKDYINKVPEDIFENIKANADLKSVPKYDMSVSLVKQGISNEGLALIYNLHYRYWCLNEEEKAKLEKIVNDNQAKLESQKK